MPCLKLVFYKTLNWLKTDSQDRLWVSSEDCMSYLRLTVCGIQTFGRLKLTMGALSAVEEESANAV